MTQTIAYIIVEKLNANPKLKHILEYCKKCNSLEIHYRKVCIDTCNIDLKDLAIKIVPKSCYYKKYNACNRCIENIFCDIRVGGGKRICTTIIYDECECVYYIHLKLPSDVVCNKKITLYIKKLQIFFNKCTKKIIDDKDLFFCTIPTKLIEEEEEEHHI